MSNPVEQIRNQIGKAILNALTQAREAGDIDFDFVPDFTIEVPREKAHGDFAANIAMVMAKAARQSPRRIAELLINRIDKSSSYIDKVEVAGPGFINFYISPRWLYSVLPLIQKMKDDYGKVNIGQGKKIQVEFVSANPTGPMHMGNARGAALGDSLANLLSAAGFDVSREFYINDAGNQIENFGLSLEARYLQLFGRDAEVPENGYHGDDITENMKALIDIEGDKYLEAPSEERRRRFIEFALERNLSRIKQDLADFGVHFDVWFSEQTLHESGKVDKVIQELTEKGAAYENEGALWFAASQYGAEKDEVLVRNNGIPTYMAADIAYHRDKFERGFEEVIDIWGADHHGHVARMKGAMAALGFDPDKLNVILMQLVRLYRNGEIARMSKRSGKAVTLADLVEEVGKDAARFFFNMRGADTHLDFDLDLAVSQSSDNPVYYVQYAHARIASILRQAQQEGVVQPDSEDINYDLLSHPAELDLLRKLADFPEEITKSALKREPHHLTGYALELASMFHAFYNACRVISDDVPLMSARLTLVWGVKTVIKNALSLLGISAPEQM
jgi:arginyl-tRNA synthetase